MNEDPLVADCLEGRSGHGEGRHDILLLAGARNVDFSTVRIGLGGWESRRQQWNLNRLFDDLIQREVSAGGRFPLCADWDEGRQSYQLVLELWDRCGIQRSDTGDA